MKPTYRRTYIRQWRQHRGLSLKRLANRLPADAEGRPAISDVSISRIERGLQPYNQAILEMLAEALNTDPASLLMRDPTQPDAIWTIWDQLKPEQQKQALVVLDALRRAS